jgi:hypothetical protein
MSNVRPHPAVLLDEKLRKAGKEFGYELMTLFREAVETGAPRKPVLEFFSPHKDQLRFSHFVYKELIPWSRASAFKIREPANHEKKESGAASAALLTKRENANNYELADQIRRLAGDLAEAEEKCENYYHEIAATHRYGFFPPGWEVDSADWSNFFDEDDPCLTIGFYLRHLFSGPSRYSATERPVFTLEQVDREILDLILSGCACHRQTFSFPAGGGIKFQFVTRRNAAGKIF